MNASSRRLAGILLVIYPTVLYGGTALLGMIRDKTPGYLDNPVRQDLWRAGHAHAAVYLLLSLVLLRYVDETNLPPRIRDAARLAAPVAAILVPAGFFFSSASPTATEPNSLIYLTYIGAAILALGLFVLGIGLIRKAPDQ